MLIVGNIAIAINEKKNRGSATAKPLSNFTVKATIDYLTATFAPASSSCFLVSSASSLPTPSLIV